jgi:hypothetical protein
MRKCLLMATSTLVLVGVLTRDVRADVVADYTDDFSYSAPASGWSYLWNANGPIGTAANYVPLVADGAPGRYETQNQTPDGFPDAEPGSSLSATATTVVPGQGTAQNAIERYVIAGYTISAADIVANGDQLILDDYRFAVSAASTDGVTARLYKNDILLVEQPLTPGLIFTSETPDANGGPIGLGPFLAGDTLYVAIGSNGIAPVPPFGPGGTDIGDSLDVDYSIFLVPEPGAASTLLLAASCLLSRRLRRR